MTNTKRGRILTMDDNDEDVVPYSSDYQPLKSDNDNFKPIFKYFKRKNPAPDLCRALDPLNESSTLQRVDVHTKDVAQDLDLTCTSTWKLYRHKGILLLSNPFTDRGHLNWSLRCLKSYTKHKTNLLLPVTGDKDGAKKPRLSSWWDDVQLDYSLLDKLRWATLGYHHNWDTKQYSLSSKSEFPEKLGQLAKYLAKQMLDVDGYNPQASIVNFYPETTTLSGHTDHSEPNRQAPLVSISFGRPAVFLIGGPTKETEPDAILLRSGDVLIMTEAARNNYHGVPRVMDQSLIDSCGLKRLNVPKIVPESSDETFALNYLSNHRININIRQVF